MHDTLRGIPIRLTYEDFCALPEDGRRYEILDGDLYMSPSLTPRHQRIAGRLFVILDEFTRVHRLGEVFPAPLDVLLAEHEIVEPDIIYVSAARSAIVAEQHIIGAPDLVVEVLSPGTAERDRRDKRNIYARCGVPFYWIVDPEGRSMTELALVDKAYAVTCEAAGQTAFQSRLFPGLILPVSELMA